MKSLILILAALTLSLAGQNTAEAAGYAGGYFTRPVYINPRTGARIVKTWALVCRTQYYNRAVAEMGYSKALVQNSGVAVSGLFFRAEAGSPAVSCATSGPY